MEQSTDQNVSGSLVQEYLEAIVARPSIALFDVKAINVSVDTP